MVRHVDLRRGPGCGVWKGISKGEESSSGLLGSSSTMVSVFDSGVICGVMGGL